MSDPDPTARWRRVKAWIRHAEDDARIAGSCIALDPPAVGGAAYHCRQAAEKLLKGFLVQAEIDFRKTHDLSVLGDLVVPRFPDLKPLVMAMEAWSTWAVAFRYPPENLPEPEPEPDSGELAAH
jgi:HEPN domain-containing protein